MTTEAESLMPADAGTATEVKLPQYEMVVVISPEDSEEQLESRVNYISKLITDQGGTVDNIDRWGKRKLAYPIKGLIEGFYMVYNFQVKAEAGKEINATLNITEDVLRHLLIRKED